MTANNKTFWDKNFIIAVTAILISIISLSFSAIQLYYEHIRSNDSLLVNVTPITGNYEDGFYVTFVNNGTQDEIVQEVTFIWYMDTIQGIGAPYLNLIENAIGPLVIRPGEKILEKLNQPFFDEVKKYVQREKPPPNKPIIAGARIRFLNKEGLLIDKLYLGGLIEHAGNGNISMDWGLPNYQFIELFDGSDDPLSWRKDASSIGGSVQKSRFYGNQ